MATWFVSDTHFGHVNVIRYCKRPFLVDPEVLDPYQHDWNLDVATMDEAMVANWNAVVGPDDTVFHVGDFAMGKNYIERVTAIRKRLNGRIILVLGNHDRSAKKMLACGFDEVHTTWSGTIEDYKVLIAHHPPDRPRAEHYDYDYILCGHVHESWKSKGKVVNVGVDVWGFRPIKLVDIVDRVRMARDLNL